MTGTGIVPPAEGGAGALGWNKCSTLTNTYHIRRGAAFVARITLWPGEVHTDQHAAALDAICQALHNQQENHP